MERLTQYILDNYDNVKEVVKKGNVLEIDLIRRLALFEDACLESSEIEQLKANQNKVAIEKLEKLKIKLNDFKVDNFSDACIVIKDMNFNINAMLAELKGGNNEKVNR
jgi:hypothetical protein